MAPWLILVIGVQYLVVAIDLVWSGKPAMAGVFAGYAASNVFLWMAVK